MITRPAADLWKTPELNSPHRFLIVITLVVAFAVFAQADDGFNTPRLESVPQESRGCQVIDWHQRAVDFDRLAFDVNTAGPLLPLLSWRDEPQRHFAIPSYVGKPSDGEAICCLAAVASGALSGINKTQDRGVNWVQACEAWFSETARVTFNNVGSNNGGGSFWYAVLPGVLHAQLAMKYPDEPGLNAKLQAMADRYCEVVMTLGGANADFNHTGFDFAKNQPVDNGKWTEPDAAAGIAYIEYAAWTKWHDDKHLEAVRWCLDSLERRKREEGSPLYETLLYYAPALAAKMNSEHGTQYDIAKLLDWCLGENVEPGVPRPHWGVLAHRFGDADVRGLQGSTRAGEGYAFAMNTFNAAAALAPLVRYDARFTNRIAQWLDQVAINASQFFADEVLAANQSNPELRDTPLRSVPYEGIREAARVTLKWVSVAARTGSIESAEALAESKDATLHCNKDGALLAMFEVPLPAHFAKGHWQIEARVAHAGALFQIKTAPSPDGPWQPAGGFAGPTPHTDGHIAAGGPLPAAKDASKLWLCIEAAGKHDADEVLVVPHLELSATLDIMPWASGDAFTNNEGPTDLAPYGGAYIGYFAALMASAKQDGIHCFDISSTDFLSPQKPRVLLYFNPSTETRTVTFDDNSTHALRIKEATVHVEAR